MKKTRKQLKEFRKMIGNNITYYRKKNNLTLRKMSAMSGLSLKLLDSYEVGKGEMHFDILGQISQTLKIDIKSLFQKF